MLDIRPCPFCGTEGRLTGYRNAGHKNGFWVECDFYRRDKKERVCNAHGPHGDSADDAIELWNKRFKETDDGRV